eukprot:863995-Pelagomonas_calceolata.AAC.1
MSDKVLGIADCVHITEDRAISDHCPISMTFQMPDYSLEDADRGMQSEHVCKPGGCGSRLSMKWRPELAEVYAEALAGNSEMQNQFEQANAKEDPVSACETACFCLHSMIVQAAGDDWA